MNEPTGSNNMHGGNEPQTAGSDTGATPVCSQDP